MTHHPRGPRRSAAEQALLDDGLKDLIERRIRFNQTMGIRLHSLKPANVQVRFEMRDELIGHDAYNRLHGGVISATLDALGGLALMVATGEKYCDETAQQVMHRFMRLGTIDLRTDFLRPGLGRYFTGSAQVVRLGGRIGTTQMQLHNDSNELISTATGSYVVA